VADSLEARILLAARDALQTILPASGYQTRPRVEFGPGAQVSSPLTVPTILVHDAEGSQAVQLVHAPPIWEHSIRFATDCWVPGGNGDGRERELFNLTADTRRCFRRNRTLGGLVRRVDEIEPDATDEAVARPVGWARLEFVAVASIEEAGEEA
jgi:hypothetical protein